MCLSLSASYVESSPVQPLLVYTWSPFGGAAGFGPIVGAHVVTLVNWGSVYALLWRTIADVCAELSVAVPQDNETIECSENK